MNETFSFETQSFDPDGIRLGVVRGISYGLFGPPGEFVPQARALGAGLIRAYVVLVTGRTGTRPLPLGYGGHAARPAHR